MESFKELRQFKPIRDLDSELKFTELLKHIYHRHRHVGRLNPPEPLYKATLPLPMIKYVIISCHKGTYSWH